MEETGEPQFVIKLSGPRVGEVVVVNDRRKLKQDADDGIIFSEFVKRARTYLRYHPQKDLRNWTVYIGFWGQWSLRIPTSFLGFLIETGVRVQLDTED